jgi:hypothetical protein
MNAGASLMTPGPSLMTTGAPFAPGPIPRTCASVRFAPSSAPLMPGPDDVAPASVPTSGPGIDDVDAPPSSGPVSACHVEAGAMHDGAGVRAPGATDTRVRAAYCSPGSAVPVARSRAARAIR